jgi:hypothetical protein
MSIQSFSIQTQTAPLEQMEQSRNLLGGVDGGIVENVAGSHLTPSLGSNGLDDIKKSIAKKVSCLRK